MCEVMKLSSAAVVEKHIDATVIDRIHECRILQEEHFQCSVSDSLVRHIFRKLVRDIISKFL